jgi:hypothetical protein
MRYHAANSIATELPLTIHRKGTERSRRAVIANVF